MAIERVIGCPDCGASTIETSWGQQTLFGHGGTEASTLRRCGDCGWSLIVAEDTWAPARFSQVRP